MDAPAPRRRRLALSLRALMLAVLVVAMAMAWFVTRGRGQARGIAAVRAMGGMFDFDYEFSAGRRIPGGKSFVPARLLRRLGPEYFHRVTRVMHMEAKPGDLGRIAAVLPRLDFLWLPKSSFAAGELAKLPAFAGLKGLDLSMSLVTDADVEHVAKLGELRSLDLGYTKITDAAIATLSRCRRLESLDLRGTRVTAEGLRALAGFPSLRDVKLFSIDDEAVLGGHGALTHLESLGISWMGRWTEEGKVPKDSLGPVLRRLTRLRILKISGQMNSGQTDTGLIDAIAALPDLEHLGVSAYRLGDADALKLRAAPRLRKLNLYHTKVTPEGKAALKTARPDLKISKEAIFELPPLPDRGS